MDTVASTTALAANENITGLAAFGKVAFALLVIVAVIVVCAWLLKRLDAASALGGQHLKVIAGKSVGGKERVVIVEVDDTWLVLGVTAGGISKLYEHPAKASQHPSTVKSSRFSKQLASIMTQRNRKDTE